MGDREPRRGAERLEWRGAPPRRLEEDNLTTEHKIIRAGWRLPVRRHSRIANYSPKARSR